MNSLTSEHDGKQSREEAIMAQPALISCLWRCRSMWRPGDLLTFACDSSLNWSVAIDIVFKKNGKNKAAQEWNILFIFKR